MNISIPISWLREYLKTDVAAKTLASLLSLSGPSVDHVEKRGEDYVFDVEITSNRVDAYSVYGLAREAHAILSNEGHKSQLIAPTGLNLKLDPDTKNLLKLDVLIKTPTLCHRFTAVVIDNVKIGPSPAFIKNRLTAAGIRPINNIVDISNYIMLELGQPMHTYDFDKVKAGKMVMREAKDGEKVTTLDDKTHKVPGGTIVMEDGSGRLIDLCGIMGGKNTEISRRTKRVIMYVQSYDPTRIRKTTQSLAFRTEAAAIFGKGVDIESIAQALSRSIYLAKKYAGGKIVSELVDIVNYKPTPKPIILNLKKLYSYLGVEIPAAKAVKILNSLGFETKTNPTQIIATPPSWRVSDVKDPEDLIEEIARIYGYHRLPSNLPQGQIPQSPKSDLEKVIELKKAFKYLGLAEVVSYSIISKKFLDLTGHKTNNAVELTNPLTEEWQFMRPTLLVSLADVIGKNQNMQENLKIFEIAKTYIPPSHHPNSPTAQLPTQDLYLSIVLQNSDFSRIKGLVENIFEVLNREVRFEKPKSRSVLFEEQEFAHVKIESVVVGTLGALANNITDYFQIEGPTAACELNLSTIYQLPSTKLSYHPIPKFPPVIEDISAIFTRETPAADIITEVKKSGSPLVKNVKIIEIYTDET